MLKGEVAMGATLPVLQLAAPAIGKFCKTYPHVRLTLERQIGMTVRSMVEDSKVDFGFLPVQPAARPGNTVQG